MRGYEFFENFERNKYLKKLPSMQRVKNAGKNTAVNAVIKLIQGGLKTDFFMIVTLLF